MPSRNDLLAGVSTLAITVALATAMVAVDASPARAVSITSANAGTSITSLEGTDPYTVGSATTISWGGGSEGYGIVVSASIVGLTNRGSVDGLYNYAAGGITTVINSGVITADTANHDVWNEGAIGTLTNTGVIFGGYVAIYNNKGTLGTGTIAVLTNASGGVISGGSGIRNYGGVIGTITNDGTITGIGDSAVYVSAIENTGSIDTISNTGTLSGRYGINNTSYLYYGTGTIAETIFGTIGTIANSGLITAHSTVQSATGIYNRGTITGGIANSGTITVSISTPYDAIGIDSSGLINGTITNTGVISATTPNANANAVVGIRNSGTIGTIINAGTITASTNSAPSNVGTIAGLVNTGVLTALVNQAGATIRADSLGAGSRGISNTGSITTLTNAGVIWGARGGNAYGIVTTNYIGTLTNSGTIYGNAGSVNNQGVIDSLANTGLIESPLYGLYNYKGVIQALTNSGTISGFVAITNYGFGATASIATLLNTGAILGTSSSGGSINGIENYSGTITSLDNRGIISAVGSGPYVRAIGNHGAIVAIDNSGTISSVGYAIYNFDFEGAGTIGAITNSGVIRGDIWSWNDLTFAGGAGGTVGTLTGYASGAKGTLTATGVIFTGGDLLLDDDMVLDGGTGSATNSGASLHVNQGISISGNYAQGGTSALVVGVTSASSYGQLVVSGTANLAGTVTIVALSRGGVQAGDVLTIVSASSLIDGGVSVGGSGGLEETSTLTGTSLLVTLTSVPISWADQAAGAGMSSSLGTALEQLSTVTGFQGPMTTLASLSWDQQNHALQQLGGQPPGLPLVIGGANTGPIISALEGHQVVMLGAGGGGRAAGSDYGRSAVWGQMLGGHASRDASAGSGGYSADSFGLLAGADFMLNDRTVAGAAVSWLRSDADGEGTSAGAATTLDSYQLTFYGAWRPDGGPLSLRGMAAAGLNRYDARRAIDFLGETAAADYNGRQFTARAIAGYDLAVAPGWTVTPLAGLQYGRVDNDAYTEKGSSMAQSVAAVGFNVVESELGGRVATGLDTDLGRLDLDLKATWAHSYTNGPIAVSAAIGGAGFVSDVERPAADGARIALGAALQKTDTLSIRLEYDGDLRDDYRSHSALLRIRQEF